MTSLAALAVEMLRYRVAVMIWMFMLLGAAYHRVGTLPLTDLLALTVALGASYVAATTVNDICDEQIDRINHPAGRGRPLVQGRTTPRELWQLNVIAAVVALLAGSAVGVRGIAVVAASLLIGYAYSVPPLLISHRTFLAGPVLTLAYVLAPYLHGLALADVTPSRHDVVFLAGLCGLFLSRIVLKDFRDRAGDAAYGKPTFLLRFGKESTCRLSRLALFAGAALTLVAVDGGPVIDLVGVTFVWAISTQLSALRGAGTPLAEQVAIGTGAKMGNGLLVCLLAWLLMGGNGATPTAQAVFVVALAGLYGSSYVVLSRRPAEVLIGYKG
ncbi:MAG: chlorophyll/bacteriochlorophyll a synthase [Actinomycetota bacterium]|jgi:4-hydroxybenzoate polyprenyltransferase|nr:chlorophyll/bacteriochlorophyll a synthase [Actinomycetota bacterium]